MVTWGQWFLSAGGSFSLQGIYVNVWRHFLFSWLDGGAAGIQLVVAEDSTKKPFHPQGNPHNKELSNQQCHLLSGRLPVMSYFSFPFTQSHNPLSQLMTSTHTSQSKEKPPDTKPLCFLSPEPNNHICTLPTVSFLVDVSSPSNPVLSRPLRSHLSTASEELCPLS